MRFFKSITLIILIGIAATGVSVKSTQAALLTINETTGLLEGATGVVVTGFGVYDVAFGDDTCANVYGVCSPANFAFTTQAGAEAAGAALAGQVLIDLADPLKNFDSAPEKVFGCGSGVSFECTSIIAFAITQFHVEGMNVNNSSSEINDDITGPSFTFFSSDLSSFTNDVNFARFTRTGDIPSAIPLPAALPLYGTGLAVMGFLGWRRKRRAAA